MSGKMGGMRLFYCRISFLLTYARPRIEIRDPVQQCEVLPQDRVVVRQGKGPHLRQMGRERMEDLFMRLLAVFAALLALLVHRFEDVV